MHTHTHAFLYVQMYNHYVKVGFPEAPLYINTFYGRYHRKYPHKDVSCIREHSLFCQSVYPKFYVLSENGMYLYTPIKLEIRFVYEQSILAYQMLKHNVYS